MAGKKDVKKERTLTLARFVHLEQLCFGDCTDLRKRHCPLASLLLARLLEHVAEHLRLVDALSVHEVCRDCRTVGRVLWCNLLGKFLLVHDDPIIEDKHKNK